MATVPTRSLGTLEVPAVGFGVMVLSPGIYADVDDTTADRALATAIEAGATFVDTSDAYGGGHNEALIARWHGGTRREQIQIATKFGMRVFEGEPRHDLHVPWNRAPVPMNAEPRLVRRYLERSLGFLATDYVDLYYPHFPDPAVPIEDTVGAIAELVAEGKVRHIGLSNATGEQLRRAAQVHPIAAVQVEWSMWQPIEPDLLDACRELGTGVVPYSPIGRGFLSGELHAQPSDWRVRVGRLDAEHLATNNDRFAPVRAIADELGLTPSQLALVWLLHQYERVVPIPGSRNPEHIRENTAAGDRTLTADELARVDAALAAFVPDGAMY